MVEIFSDKFGSAKHAKDHEASNKNTSGTNQGAVDSSDCLLDREHRAYDAQSDAKLRETVVLLAAAGLGSGRYATRCDCLSAA